MKTVAIVDSGPRYGLRGLHVAKTLGYRVVFVCDDIAAHKNAHGGGALEDADAIVVADTLSWRALRDALGTHRVDGIVAFGDHHLLPAAQAARARGLPHADPEALRRARRKDLMRQWLRDKGLAMPRSVLLDRVANTSPIGYPCVVKPTDGSGGIGVHRADADSAFRSALEDVLLLTAQQRDFQAARKALVEEYLHGTELSAEAVWDGSRWELLGISSRRNEGPIGAAEVALTFPALLDARQQAAIEHSVLAWLEASGLDFGAAHVELRVGAAGPQLIEINARCGAFGLTELVRHATGFDPLAFVIAQAVGDKPALPPCPLAATRAATLEFLVSHGHGTLRAVDGLEDVQRMPGVVAAGVTTRTPRRVIPLLNNDDVLGFALAVAADAAASCQQARAAVRQFRLDLK